MISQNILQQLRYRVEGIAVLYTGDGDTDYDYGAFTTAPSWMKSQEQLAFAGTSAALVRSSARAQATGLQA